MPAKVKIRVGLIISVCLIVLAVLLYLSITYNILFLIIFLFLLLLGIYLIFVFYPKFDPTGFTIYKLKKGDKRVAFTFDDGPDPFVTPQILDILKNENINAIFFCVGSRAERYPELVKRIREEGHLLGNHGYSHIKLHNKGFDFVKNEIERSEEILSPLSDINGKRLFRTPHGFKNFRLIEFLRSKNYILIGWTRGIWDSDGSSVEILLSRAEKYLEDGVIFLFHDGRDVVGTGTNTVEFLKKFIPVVKSRGFQITNRIIE